MGGKNRAYLDPAVRSRVRRPQQPSCQDARLLLGDGERKGHDMNCWDPSVYTLQSHPHLSSTGPHEPHWHFCCCCVVSRGPCRQSVLVDSLIRWDCLAGSG